MFITLVVSAEIHIIFFGVFTEDYDTHTEALFHTFDLLANGITFSAGGDYNMNSPIGYPLFYLFATLFLMLVLSQFFIAILVSAWDAASDIKKEQAEASKLPPGFSWGQDTNEWHSRGVASLFMLTGYSIQAGASGAAIKYALRYAISTLELKINRLKSNTTALTQDEENEIFLFDHGLVVAKDVKDKLVEMGLKERTAKYLLARFTAPGMEVVNEGSGTSYNAMAKKLRQLEEQVEERRYVPSASLELMRQPREVDTLEATIATLREQTIGLQRRVDELVFKETMVSTIVRAVTTTAPLLRSSTRLCAKPARSGRVVPRKTATRRSRRTPTTLRTPPIRCPSPTLRVGRILVWSTTRPWEARGPTDLAWRPTADLCLISFFAPTTITDWSTPCEDAASSRGVPPEGRMPPRP